MLILIGISTGLLLSSIGAFIYTFFKSNLQDKYNKILNDSSLSQIEKEFELSCIQDDINYNKEKKLKEKNDFN